ncbi:MAG: adenylyl-sulfate kinase [Flavobacteriaceae bacterium]|nr:adenylyl-sulfate kinase [Flavobacteriaceae bacterium]
MALHISEHNFNISVKDRQRLNKHNSFVIWFTGLSGSGKSTLANTLEQELYKSGIRTYCLDGDNLRTGINKDLTFEPEDRVENIRRVAEIAKILIDSGIVVLATFISPYKSNRDAIKEIVGKEKYIEIFVNTSIEECKNRDPKGLYKKAQIGEIKNMTGISAPYEIPNSPNLEIKTETESVSHSTKRILEYISPKLQTYNNE